MFRGPRYFDADLTINKSFVVTERLHMIIGANFFNVFNHPNFDLPVNNVAAGDFGTVVSTVSPVLEPVRLVRGFSSFGAHRSDVRQIPILID